uniref:Uncharacterized protein n=1 Tax=Arundo donax TaxID=35708 RepID=A0A0A8XQW7_ARUDO
MAGASPGVASPAIAPGAGAPPPTSLAMPTSTVPSATAAPPSRRRPRLPQPDHVGSQEPKHGPCSVGQLNSASNLQLDQSAGRSAL